jgi:hypothetical protein
VAVEERAAPHLSNKDISVMFQTGSKAIAFPVIRRSIIRPASVEGVCNFAELKDATHRKTGSYRQHSSFRNSNKIKGSRHDRSRLSEATANLMDARLSIQTILSRLSTLSLAPPSLSVASTPLGQNNEDEVFAILKDTKGILHSLIASVNQGVLNPSGKHGKELSKFLELVLYVYSHITVSPSNVSLFEECQEVLNTLHKWNLNVRSKPYEYAITAANREERWKEASTLFLKQIDPDAGSNPFNVSISNPQGLYAVARWAQEENLAVVEHVMDAVLQLTMVSPSDQRTCKLLYLLLSILGLARKFL